MHSTYVPESRKEFQTFLTNCVCIVQQCNPLTVPLIFVTTQNEASLAVHFPDFMLPLFHCC